MERVTGWYDDDRLPALVLLERWVNVASNLYLDD